LRVEATGRVPARATLERVARLLDVDHDARAVRDHLQPSPMLRARLERVPGMRPPGAWSPFELCVRTILGQQVTVAAAGTLMRRLVDRCGSITPECLAAANLDSMGMPGKRVDALRSFAAAALQGLDFDRPWSDVEAALKTLPGFGPWTRAYLGIRLGRDPDAFPETDIGLIRAAQVDTPGALLALAQAWRPYRAYAATYLWSVAAND
jgi:3-methyladenine DNA glycosylase/8-oxoguanine DNA glycosylase